MAGLDVVRRLGAGMRDDKQGCLHWFAPSLRARLLAIAVRSLNRICLLASVFEGVFSIKVAFVRLGATFSCPGDAKAASDTA